MAFSHTLGQQVGNNYGTDQSISLYIDLIWKETELYHISVGNTKPDNNTCLNSRAYWESSASPDFSLEHFDKGVQASLWAVLPATASVKARCRQCWWWTPSLPQSKSWTNPCSDSAMFCSPVWLPVSVRPRDYIGEKYKWQVTWQIRLDTSGFHKSHLICHVSLTLKQLRRVSPSQMQSKPNRLVFDSAMSECRRVHKTCHLYVSFIMNDIKDLTQYSERSWGVK